MSNKKLFVPSFLSFWQGPGTKLIILNSASQVETRDLLGYWLNPQPHTLQENIYSEYKGKVEG